MSLVTTKTMLETARKRCGAVGAFNIENMEMAQAVVWAAEAQNAPVILQTTPGTLRYAEPKVFFGIVSALAAGSRVPVALHLDHGDSFELAARALDAGYTSVMIDGSQLPFEENVALTLRVAEAAHAVGVPVEGELGRVGGKEDDMEAEEGAYTDPALAAEFVARTGVDFLAVAIGTAHGVYAKTPVLDKERLSELDRCAGAPLVLHGASGLPGQDIVDCVGRGICKVNFATELRIAFMEGVRAALAKDPRLADPKTAGRQGGEYVRRLAAEKMKICGCVGME